MSFIIGVSLTPAAVCIVPSFGCFDDFDEESVVVPKLRLIKFIEKLREFDGGTVFVSEFMPPQLLPSDLVAAASETCLMVKIADAADLLAFTCMTSVKLFLR
jgi:hypothetical protein